MDIQERADEYAKGRLSAIIERVIAEIYSDGYQAGYKTKSDEVDEVILQKIAEAKAEVARAEAIKAAKKAEAEQIAREKAEAEKAEAERIAREKAEAEKAEAERIAREKAEAEKIAAAEAEAKRKVAAEAAKKEKEARKKVENDKKDEAANGISFVDLHLPSGTLWGKISSRIPFRDALKRYHLPTQGQLRELVHECKLSGGRNGFEFLSGDGIIFNIGCDGYDRYNNPRMQFWLDAEEDSDKNVRIASVTCINGCSRVLHSQLFVGERLSLLIVKSKQ